MNVNIGVVTKAKQNIRSNLAYKNQHFDRSLYQKENESIFQAVIQLVNNIFRKNDSKNHCFNLGLYWPLKSEPDLLKTATMFEEYVSLPKISGLDMIFVKYKSGDKLEKYGSSDLYQPVLTREVIPNVVIVPGLAFSISGYRLGFGKGHYDRYFAKIKHDHLSAIVGTCFHDRLYDVLPYDNHDYKCDYVITDKILIRI